MIRRVMAYTSSVLFVAGTTPWPTANDTPKKALMPVLNTRVQKENVNTLSSTKPNELDYVNVVKLLRQQHRLSEVHYAVSDDSIVPIWQDKGLYKTLMDKQLHRKPSTASTHRTASVAPARVKPSTKLSSRGGGLNLPQLQEGGFGIQVSRLALSLIGSPYHWGGTNPNGFDCSGFTRYVYQKLGSLLPRTSYEQFQIGTPVDKSELQPGDLVFFATTSRGPSHVAIYVGNGLIVHALNHSTGVIVSKLASAYYVSHYVGARRLPN